MAQGCLIIILLLIAIGCGITYVESVTRGFQNATHGYLSAEFVFETLPLMLIVFIITLSICMVIEKTQLKKKYPQLYVHDNDLPEEKQKGLLTTAQEQKIAKMRQVEQAEKAKTYRLKDKQDEKALGIKRKNPFQFLPVNLFVSFYLLFIVGLWAYSFTPSGRAGRTIIEKQQAQEQARQDAQQAAEDAQAAAQQQQADAQQQAEQAADAQKQAAKQREDQENETVDRIGDTGHLRLVGGETGGQVLIATSKDAWVDLDKEILANDDVGIQQMEDQGTVYAVQEGTQAKLIDISGFLEPVLRIRIVDGNQAGQDGYIDPQWLKKL